MIRPRVSEMESQGIATNRKGLLGRDHGADLLRDVCVAETGRMDVEGCCAGAGWTVCGECGTVVVGAKDTAEDGWEAAGRGGLFVVVVEISV